MKIQTQKSEKKCNEIKMPKKKIISKSLDKVFKTKKQKIDIDLDIQEPTKIKSFYYYFKNKDINSKFYLKNNQNNIIYFDCGKKNKGCKGKILYNKKLQEFFLTEECNENICHDNATFEFFYENYKNKTLDKFNMNLNKLQKFYIRSVFKSNVANDINTEKRLFYTTFNININLSKEELNKEKHLGLDIYNKLGIISLWKKLLMKRKI